MTIHAPITPATLSPSWPLRWEAAKGKGRAHEDYILRTIAAEAVRDETAIFMAAMNAADADAECRDEFIAELEDLFAAADEAEREQDRAYRYECRTGREAA